jgi:hypothetical protein
MTFQTSNSTNPTYIAPQDRASLQPEDWSGRGQAPAIKRDRHMDWTPDLVNDATEWIQRAGMGDEAAIKEVCLSVAPALLAEVKTLRG